MDRLMVQENIANFVMPIEKSPLSGDESRRFNLPLLIETVLAMVVAVGGIKVFGNGLAWVRAWLMPPGILLIAALLPIVVKRSGFSQLGFNINRLKDSLTVLGWTCIIVLPITFCCLWLLKSFGIDLFLRSVFPHGRGWIYWFVYQFMYIALAEEVFFRGYVQSNILRLTTPIMDQWSWRRQWMSIGISAACFAIAHVIVQGHIVSALTFLPGLVLGWLFIRTKSLLAPVLFHGLTNAFYFAISFVFA